MYNSKPAKKKKASNFWGEPVVEEEGAEPPLKNGIVVISCGTCRPEGEWRDGFGRASWTKGSKKETKMRSALETLKMNPVILSKSKVDKVARAITSCEVAFITDNGWVGYRDIDEVVKGLTSKDRLMNNRERLIEGQEGRHLLPYLAGGLTSSWNRQRRT
ncbi:hypothetical protein Q7P37_001022 [Cladosporium fusiforme]